jgi:hypothetical protein
MDLPNLLLKLLLLLTLHEKLLTTLLQRSHRSVLILLSTPLVLLQLHQTRLIDQSLALLVELCPQTLQLDFVLSQQCLLIDILVDDGLVLDVLGSIGEFHRAQCFLERVYRR